MAEIEQITAEAHRRTALLIDEIQAINLQTAYRAERFAADTELLLRQATEQQHTEKEAKEPEPAVAQPIRENWHEPAPCPQATPPPLMIDPNRTPQQTEIHAAVARARAARRAHSTVTPSDGDVDPESEYYRRSVWIH
ncbi:hypothetical protein ACFO5K_25820 [Nocardia halotolerans]|uniref:Uncharacterized protein n=1 Tax=Nocardia halotolerans TaxID=1755878 RepID=A0ABV8VN93_9NOCA